MGLKEELLLPFLPFTHGTPNGIREYGYRV